MAATWREERPDAITAASHSAERPSRSMVTMFSALSSSSEARMRVSNSLETAALRTCLTARALGAAAFFLGDFPAVFFLDLFRVWTAFAAAFLAGFFAGAGL